MLTRLRRRAEAMFRMAGFKVKFILRGSKSGFKGHTTLFPFHPVIIEPLEWFRRHLTNVYHIETTCRSYVQVILRVLVSYDCVCIALHFHLVTVLLFLFGRSYFVSLIFSLNYFPFMLAYFVTFLLFAVRQKKRKHFFMVQHGWYLQLFGVFGHFYTWLVFSGWGLRFFLYNFNSF